MKADAEKFFDEILPFIESDGDNSHDKANDTIDLMRTTLTECIHVDNLSNYNGTVYQLYNGLTDFIQHYYKDGTKGYDLNHKISILPGIGTADTKIGWIKKLFAMQNELAA